ncbi:thiol-disulfide oxidoreductase DCC family protein [Shivajiella indica]|uniref:Thiol-disulfide oxidoreductase DCC family protein n=1 Tax=Shivajiella indica TaxID=872115 RepID=A0ABW5BGE9_9BACT
MRIQDRFDIILFDGVCNLCNDAVDFIIKRDKKNKYKFVSLQDGIAQKLLENYKLTEGFPDSILLVRGNDVFSKSRAALEISKNLSGFWPIFYTLILFPGFLRDPIYDWIARNRYKWFGKKETCRLPNEREKSKFLNSQDL